MAFTFDDVLYVNQVCGVLRNAPEPAALSADATAIFVGPFVLRQQTKEHRFGSEHYIEIFRCVPRDQKDAHEVQIGRRDTLPSAITFVAGMLCDAAIQATATMPVAHKVMQP